MGIQTNYWGGIEIHMRIKSLLGILRRPMTYAVTSVFFIVSILAFRYAFAQEVVNSAPSTADKTLSAPNYTSTARLGSINREGIEELVSRVGELNDKKSQLDNAWRIERNKYDAMKIRIDDSKKTIRLEMDEVLLNDSPRERLDELLSQHEGLSKNEKEAAKQVTQLEEKLSAHQLLLIQANRDLERMRTLYAAQQREQDIQRVQEITRFLDRDLSFSENISFKCSTTKSLAACLNDYPLDSIIQNGVREHYQTALSNELAEKIGVVRLNSDWYSTQTNHNFTGASMSLDGSVSAEIEIRASIVSRKMMACSLLKASADLCEAQSASLIVRSNKHGDQVYINNKPYGSTPLSIMLDPGVYNVKIKYQELTQNRKLTLDENRQLNFVF
ncbi:MAG: PEGA domain-containing protein [Candidatus Oceanisphaera merdipullorum]|nr:PEGA domain-containing protein [Candidatus Oceanisphaera merdipullorum]